MKVGCAGCGKNYWVKYTNISFKWEGLKGYSICSKCKELDKKGKLESLFIKRKFKELIN